MNCRRCKLPIPANEATCFGGYLCESCWSDTTAYVLVPGFGINVLRSQQESDSDGRGRHNRPRGVGKPGKPTNRELMNRAWGIGEQEQS